MQWLTTTDYNDDYVFDYDSDYVLNYVYDYVSDYVFDYVLDNFDQYIAKGKSDFRGIFNLNIQTSYGF